MFILLGALHILVIGSLMQAGTSNLPFYNLTNFEYMYITLLWGHKKVMGLNVLMTFLLPENAIVYIYTYEKKEMMFSSWITSHYFCLQVQYTLGNMKRFPLKTNELCFSGVMYLPSCKLRSHCTRWQWMHFKCLY